jgi:alpha-ketoglutarate-dependent taurine dioxygenase
MLTLNFDRKEALNSIPVRDLVLQHRLVLIRGLGQFAAREFEQTVALMVGGYDHLLRWDFGWLMEVREDVRKDNYLFTSEAVPMHWDGAFHVSPFILAFQCAEAASTGGGTTFCDTTRVWQEATDAEREEWSRLRLTLQTEKKAHYGGTRTLPLVDRHPVSGDVVLRAAERVTTRHNPVEVTIEGGSTKDWLSDFGTRFYDPRFAHTHIWQAGDILFADNHALLHGRQAFSGAGRRCLRRVQILN